MKKFMKRALQIFLILFIGFSLIPYLIPTGSGLYRVEDIASADSRFTTVQGIRIHHHLYPATDPKGTVVFIHGFGGSLFSFLNNVDPLVEAHYNVVLVDLPGFGLSQRGLEADYSNPGRAELLLALANNLPVTGPFHWVGHSMGGSIVSWIPVLDPSAAESIVLVAAPYASEAPAPMQKLLLSYPPVQRFLEILWPRFVTEKRVGSLLSTAYGRSLQQKEVDGYLKPLLVKETHLTFVGLVRDRSSLSPDLSKVTHPYLIIWGSEDTWVSIENAPRWQETLPSSRLEVIPGAAHNPMETHTAEFNEILLDFLSSQKDG